MDFHSIWLATSSSRGLYQDPMLPISSLQLLSRAVDFPSHSHAGVQIHPYQVPQQFQEVSFKMAFSILGLQWLTR